MSIVTGLTINKFIDNEFTITIKKSRTLYPIVIAPEDTFSMQLIRLSDNSKIATIAMDEQDPAGYIRVEDDDNGRIAILLREEFINSLESKRGSASDNYYSVPTYRILLSADTQDNGKMLVQIDNVKVV